jgi:hypothetical protein
MSGAGPPEKLLYRPGVRAGLAPAIRGSQLQGRSAELLCAGGLDRYCVSDGCWFVGWIEAGMMIIPFCRTA